jgi:transcriptional regulator of acetoin/glycerol metabolism
MRPPSSRVRNFPLVGSGPFFTTPSHRAALARERFFEQGERPAGLVSDAVIQSWSRCVAAGHSPADHIPPQAVSRLRLDGALRNSRLLRFAATPGLDRLQTVLKGTLNRVLLTNADGVIVATGRHTSTSQRTTLDAYGGVGMDLSESNLGTTAPGIVVSTGEGCTVFANEHFNDAILNVQCAAAPIHDIDGRLVGVLDISVEHQGFGFDAYTLVSSYASDVENALLLAQSHNLVILAFHVEPSLIHTPMAGLAGIDQGGLVRWINVIGHRLTGGQRGFDAQEVFGIGLDGLLGVIGLTVPSCLVLPNGLSMWAMGRLHDNAACSAPALPGLRADPDVARDTGPPEGQAAQAASAGSARQSDKADGPASLHQAQARNIDLALATCNRNVSRAARMLGVSRGVIYRHLRKFECNSPRS